MLRAFDFRMKLSFLKSNYFTKVVCLPAILYRPCIVLSPIRKNKFGFQAQLNSWVVRAKEPPKFIILSSSSMRRGKFISVNSFSAQEHASSKNRHILNFRVMAVRDIKL